MILKKAYNYYSLIFGVPLRLLPSTACHKNASKMLIKNFLSPNQHYTARVYKIINSGFGTGYAITSVKLWQRGQTEGSLILGLLNDKDYRNGITRLDINIFPLTD